MRTVNVELEIGKDGRTVVFECRVCKERTLSSSLNGYGKEKRCLRCALDGKK